MAKAIVNNELYRFGVYSVSRGWCEDCGERADCFLIRTHAPKKTEYRICYSCFIDFMEDLRRRRAKHDRKTEKKIKTNRSDTLAKARAAKRKKKEKRQAEEKARTAPICPAAEPEIAEAKIIETLKERKKCGRNILQTMDDTEGGEPPPEKKNDGSGIEGGGNCAVNSAAARTAQK